MGSLTLVRVGLQGSLFFISFPFSLFPFTRTNRIVLLPLSENKASVYQAITTAIVLHPRSSALTAKLDIVYYLLLLYLL